MTERPEARAPTKLARTFLPDLYASMNKTEKRRAVELEAMKRAGKIAAWHYEKVTFKLADDTRYTPDFMVIGADGTVRFEEIKGYWRDDAKVKIKVAAAQFPFIFASLVATKTGWTLTDFTQAHAA